MYVRALCDVVSALEPAASRADAAIAAATGIAIVLTTGSSIVGVGRATAFRII
jgi:hypothetical protein